MRMKECLLLIIVVVLFISCGKPDEKKSEEKGASVREAVKEKIETSKEQMKVDRISKSPFVPRAAAA